MTADDFQLAERATLLNDKTPNPKGRYVLYWMQMYKRAENNFALDFAITRANELRLPVVVYEGLKYYYPWASDRIHTFILEGVEENRQAFAARGIKYLFYLQKDSSSETGTVARLAKHAALIVTDDFPCFIIPGHNARVAAAATVPVFAVDSNGVIPKSQLRNEEYAAYTIRPKIRKLLDRYFVPTVSPEPIVKRPNIDIDCPDTEFGSDDIASLVSECEIDHTVAPSKYYRGGTENGRRRLGHFLKNILPDYAASRNRPELDGSSRLSPYLHFGFLSAIEIALAVRDADAPERSKDAFLEELIVRRELSFNFTRNNPKYDSLESLPPWVQKTMREHRADPRGKTYSLEELEAGETDDELWNAAQREMTITGEMHNYVRMLWGKNVIGWTESYDEAFAFLEHLNNKYCLDGRDPNSYAGILWCFGKHDRPWMERPVFGTIRYMTSASTGRKFDSKRYIKWVNSLGS